MKNAVMGVRRVLWSAWESRCATQCGAGTWWLVQRVLRNLPMEMDFQGETGGWLHISDGEGGVQSGREILEVEGAGCRCQGESSQHGWGTEREGWGSRARWWRSYKSGWLVGREAWIGFRQGSDIIRFALGKDYFGFPRRMA